MKHPARSILLILAILAVSLFLSDGTLAVEARQQSSALDSLVVPKVGAAIGTRAVRIDDLAEDEMLRTAWTALERELGGTWSAWIDERSGVATLIRGSGSRWFDPQTETPTLDELEARARALLSRHPLILGSREGRMVLDRGASGQTSDSVWSLRFRQEVNGVPVDEAKYVLHIVQGNLTIFGAMRWGEVRRTDEPALDLQTARRVVHAHIGPDLTKKFDESAPPELRFVPIDPSGERAKRWTGTRGDGYDHVLVWRFRLERPGLPGRWVADVDADSGRVVSFYDELPGTEFQGGVYPLTDDWQGWEGNEQPGFPLPYCNYTEDGILEETNDHGLYFCTPGSLIETELHGRYAHMTDSCGSLFEQTVCHDVLDLGTSTGSNCAVPPGLSLGDTHAMRTTYYHVARAMERAHRWMPASSWFPTQLLVRVNTDHQTDPENRCGAWGSAEGLEFTRADPGCRNAGENMGIINHECGHALDFGADQGGADNPAEAYADIVAFFATRESCIGRGFRLSDCRYCLDCTGVRDQDWQQLDIGAPVDVHWVRSACGSGDAPCGRGIYCEARMLAQAVWDLAARDLSAFSGWDAESAWQIAESIFYRSRFGSGGDAYYCDMGEDPGDEFTHGCFADSWFYQFRAIDDDDGNDANGTPNAMAIFEAFDRHGLACGDRADPANQNSFQCVFQKPEITVIDYGTGSYTVKWHTDVPGATQYRILRNDLGCDRAQTRIATLAAPDTDYVDDLVADGVQVFYRIQPVAPYCEASTVSNCQSPAPDNDGDDWSAGNDCDDSDPDQYPHAAELCNGEDDDCDGMRDEGHPLFYYYRDADGDGWGDHDDHWSWCLDYPPAGHVANDADCDDSDGYTYPGASELCDGNDNDCNGVVPDDEDDLDGDGWVGCDAWDDRQGDDPEILGGDDPNQDDSDSWPGAPEVCDARDNDGDELIDEGCDRNCDAPQVSGTEQRVTTEPSISTNARIAFRGKGYGITWADYRDGNYEIYYANFERGKVGNDTRLTDAAGSSSNPSIVWTGNRYGLAWSDTRDGQSEIYFARLDYLGYKFEPERRITSQTASSDYPSVVWNGSDYAIAWHDNRDGNHEIYFTRLDAEGNKIGGDLRVTNAAGSSYQPKLIWTGSEYALAWYDARHGGWEVYFVRLTASGAKIGSDLRVTSHGTSTVPALTWNGAAYGLAWSDTRDGANEIYFSRLNSSGVKIDPDLRVTTSDGVSSEVDLVTTGSDFGLVWRDVRDGNDEIYFARIDAGGNKLGSDLRVTDDPASSRFPALAWSADEFGILWRDKRDGNLELYFTAIACCDDVDADGYTDCAGDSNDKDAELHPGAFEVCDGADNDGDGDLDGICDGSCDNPALWDEDLQVTADTAGSRRPSLAWTRDGHGIAWSDEREDGPQIYFARVDAGGVKLGSDVQVSTQPNAFAPSLTWTGAEYAVAWEYYPEGRPGPAEIYFVRLTASGNRIGLPVRLVALDSSSPALVWTGDDYGLAWVRRTGYADRIWMTRIDRYGNRIGSHHSYAGHNGVSDPALVWDGSGFGLAWSNTQDGSSQIYLARIDASGYEVGPAQSVATMDGFRPSVAWTGTEYGVAWEDQRAGSGGIYLRRFDALGAPVGLESRISEVDDVADSPALAWNGTEYGVVWHDSRGGVPELYFARIDAAGGRVGVEHQVTTISGASEYPSLVWNGTRYAVAWEDDRLGGGNAEIFFNWISCCDDLDDDGYSECANDSNDADPYTHPLAPELCDSLDNDGNGTIDDGCDGVCDNPEKEGDDQQITAAAESSWQPSMVWARDQYAIAWGDEREGNGEIYFARIDSAGVKQGADLRLTNDPGDSWFPSMVWTGSEFGITWRDERDGNDEIYLARVDSAGGKLGDDVRLTADEGFSARPSIVWNGSGYAVAWQDDRPGNSEIYFARVDPAGARIGSELRVTDDSAFSISVSLAWNGSGYGLAWADNRAGNWEIYFARLDEQGSPVGTEVRVTSAAGSSMEPCLIWTGSHYAVAWLDSRDGNGDSEIYFVRLDATGTKIGSDVRITNDPNESSRPSLVWTGEEYGLSWDDDREGGFDVFFVQLDPSGNKKQEDGNATENPADSTNSTLIWTGQRYALAWQDNRTGNEEIWFLHARCCDDLDLDTFTECQNDCDDSDAAVYPGAPEICDYKDNDCNGSTDEGFLTPGSTEGLGFEADKQTLHWSVQPSAEVYDLVQGDLAGLRASGGDFSSSISDCLENDGADTQAADSSAPGPGQGRFYLVRAQTACRHGTYDTSHGGQVTGRDEGVDASPAACP